MGDFNDLKVDEICDSCKIKQVVNVPTRNQVTLDLILTNDTNGLYKDPTTLPSIGGSDHLCVLLEPADNLRRSKVIKKKVLKREFKKICNFRIWIMDYKLSME